MELEDVFVSGPCGRQVLRAARRSMHLAIVENDHLPSHRERDLSTPGLPNLGDFGINMDDHEAIDLWFADQASRYQARNVRCHVASAQSIKQDAFVVVQALDIHGVGKAGARIRCESPNFSVLQYAIELHRVMSDHALSQTDVIVLLTAYVMELLGSYAKDPRDPQGGEDAFKLEPATTKDSLLSFLDRMRGYPCVAMARKAATLAIEGAASRMETLAALATSLPPRFGGASIEGVVLNQPLPLTSSDLKLIKHRSIRPDLLWDSYRLIVEYDGTGHDAPKQKREDKNRIQDYQTLGFTVFPISYEDVSCVIGLDHLLSRIIEVIGRYKGRQYVRNKRRLLRNPDQRRKRSRLLQLLLPRRRASTL